MVQIPTSRDVGYVGTRSGRIAPSGPTPMVGAALANLGQGLTQAGFNLNDLREQENADRLNNRANEVSTSLTRFLADEEERFLKAREGTSESGIGFTRQFMEGYQQRADEFAKTNFEGLSEDAQTGYVNNILSRGNSLFEKATAFETQTKGAYYERTTNTSLDTYRTQIGNNAANFEDLKRQGIDAINATNMPEPWKAERRAIWESDAAESKWRWEFSQNPTQAIQEVKGRPGSLVDKIVGVESGGNDSAKNPLSSAEGAGQFIDSTWLSMIKKYRPDVAEGKSANEILALKRDGALSREMVARYADENKAFLANQGLQTTDGNAYLAHFLGPRGAAQVLKADPSASIASVVGQDVVRANPFLKGKSAADVIAWADKKMGGAGVTTTYDAIPYERREQLAAWGETQYSQQVNQQRAAAKDSYALMIATQPEQVRESVILADPLIDDGDAATLVTSLRTAMKDTGAVNAMIGAMASGQVSVNPFDSEQTRIADKTYDKVSTGIAEPAQRQAVTADFIERTGHIPKAVQAELRQGAMSTDPSTLATALSTADLYQRTAPIAFGAFEGSKAIGDRLEMYRHFVNNLGMSGEDAVNRIIRATDPARVMNREVLKPEADKFTKNLGAKDVASSFGGIFSSPGVGLLPQQTSQMTAEFRELAEEAFYETGGDQAAAKAIALGEMRKRWNVTQISGKPHVMRLPPEMHYPAVNGSHEYLRADALETAESYVAELFPGRKVENVAVRADENTRADIQNGRPPRYRLFYQYQEDGQTRYDEVFAGPWGLPEADIKTRMDEQRQSQRRDFDERRATAERAAAVRDESGAAADTALDETVGPDWMRARAAEAAREGGRTSADQIEADNRPEARARRAAAEETERQRREYLERERTNAGNLLRGRPYGTEGNR